MNTELESYLNSLARNECFRVEKVLKQSPAETTEVVSFQGANGSTIGPFIRKKINATSSLGQAYQRIWQAQQDGVRFRYLPRVCDYFETEDSRIVIMEHLSGKTLEEFITTSTLSTKEILSLFSSICDAVDELHERFDPPIIHRDLKPSNIMISGETVTLIDFGIARSFQDEAETDTQHFGTRCYAPPEQFGFSQTDIRSDEYTLALLLYFCFTKKDPSNKDREQGFYHYSVPARISEVIAKATSLDPSDRYENVRELKAAVLQAVSVAPASQTVRDQATQAQSTYGQVAHGQNTHGQGTYNQGAFGQTTNNWAAQNQNAQGQTSYNQAPRPTEANTPSNPIAAFKQEGEKLSQKIPKPLKIVWDIALLAVLLLFVVAAVSLALNPKGTGAIDNGPFELRLIAYLIICLFVFGPMAFLCSFRDPLEVLPFYRKRKLWVELLICAVAIFCGLLAVGFIAVIV